MSRTVVARWQDWSGESLEHLVLQEGADGVRADGAVVAVADGEVFAVRYRVLCDVGWRTRHLEVDLVGADRRLELSGDGSGHWTDRSGASFPDLAGAIDVDLSATPFTNTLPIRRLSLRGGASETIVAVYIRLPALTVTTDRQRYTCLEPGRRYRYESVDSDFSREIDVDVDGLVVTYPGLFHRVL